MIKFLSGASAKRKLAQARNILIIISLVISISVTPVAAATNDYTLVDTVFTNLMSELGCKVNSNCYVSNNDIDAAATNLKKSYVSQVVDSVTNFIKEMNNNSESSRGTGDGSSRGGGGGGKFYTESEKEVDQDGNVVNNYYIGDTVYNEYVTNETINYYDNDTVINETYNDYYTVNNNSYYTTNKVNKKYYTTNNYNYYGSLIAVSETPTHTQLSYVDGGGSTVTNKYYYELSDGRNTYFLSADDVYGEVINYEYINYDTVAENDGTYTLIHFNGELKDDSYYRSNINYNGALSYIDSGNFHQALIFPTYTDESTNLSFSMPAGYSSASAFTLEYRFYIPNIVQWNPSMNWSCHTTKTGGYVVSDYDSTLNSACNATAVYEDERFNSIVDLDILDLPGLNIDSDKGDLVLDIQYFEDSTKAYKYKLTSKGSSIYYGYDKNSGSKISYGLWHSVVIQSNSGTAKVYLDGSYIGNTAANNIVNDNGIITFNQLKNEVAPYYYLDEVRLSSGNIYDYSAESIVVTSNEFDTNKIYVLPDFGGSYEEELYLSTKSSVGTLNDSGSVVTNTAESQYMVMSDDYIEVNGLTTYKILRNKDYDYYIYEYDSNKKLLQKSKLIIQDEYNFTTLNNTKYIKYATKNEFTYKTCFSKSSDVIKGDIRVDVGELKEMNLDLTLTFAYWMGTSYESASTSVKNQWHSYNGLYNVRITYYNSAGKKISSNNVSGRLAASNASNPEKKISTMITTPEDCSYFTFNLLDNLQETTPYFYGRSLVTEANCEESIINTTKQSTDFSLSLYHEVYYATELTEGTIALKNDLDLRNASARYGGVRPTYPNKSQIYFVTSNDYITQVQIYDGSDWLATGGVIYLNGNWRSLIGSNLLDSSYVINDDDYVSGDDIQDCLNDDNCDINDVVNPDHDKDEDSSDNITNENNTIINILLGDFLSGLLDGLASLLEVLFSNLITLFVPEPEFFRNIFNDLELDFSSKLGVLNVPFIALESLVNLFNASDEVNAVIHIPSIAVPGFEDIPIIQEREFDLNQLVDDAGMTTFYNYYLNFIDAACVIALLLLASKKWKEVSRG